MTTVYKDLSDHENRNSHQGQVQPVDGVQQGSFWQIRFALVSLHRLS